MKLVPIKDVMKFALTLFLIIGFIGIAVFSVFAMGDHKHGNCIASIAKGVDCPAESNTVTFLNFHLDAFRSFSTATFGGNLANALLLLIALVLIAAFGVIARIQSALSVLAANYRRRQFLESYFFPFQRELIHWLVLHENSPTTA